ncbi:MAG: glycosyltransferase family 39 protein [archaeon]
MAKTQVWMGCDSIINGTCIREHPPDHPILYTFLLSLLIMFFGNRSNADFYFIQTVFTFSIILFYLTAKKITNIRTAILSTVIFAFFPLNILYSVYKEISILEIFFLILFIFILLHEIKYKFELSLFTFILGIQVRPSGIILFSIIAFLVLFFVYGIKKINFHKVNYLYLLCLIPLFYIPKIGLIHMHSNVNYIEALVGHFQFIYYFFFSNLFYTLLSFFTIVYIIFKIINNKFNNKYEKILFWLIILNIFIVIIYPSGDTDIPIRYLQSIFIPYFILASKSIFYFANYFFNNKKTYFTAVSIVVICMLFFELNYYFQAKNGFDYGNKSANNLLETVSYVTNKYYEKKIVFITPRLTESNLLIINSYTSVFIQDLFFEQKNATRNLENIYFIETDVCRNREKNFDYEVFTRYCITLLNETNRTLILEKNDIRIWKINEFINNP